MPVVPGGVDDGKGGEESAAKTVENPIANRSGRSVRTLRRQVRVEKLHRSWTPDRITSRRRCSARWRSWIRRSSSRRRKAWKSDASRSPLGRKWITPRGLLNERSYASSDFGSFCFSVSTGANRSPSLSMRRRVSWQWKRSSALPLVPKKTACRRLRRR